VKVLGISAWYHDAAAALVIDGRPVAAAQEERFTRRKHDPNFPTQAVRWCLAHAGITVNELDAVAFYEKPFLKFERLLDTFLSYAPHGLPTFLQAMPVWIKEKLWIKSRLTELLPGYGGPFCFPEHHESHAASAFYASPYPEAAILTIDGVGEWACTTWGLGQGNRLDLHAEQRFPHSLGLLYSALTYYLGFKVNSGEYKVMGLAPYGEPKYTHLFYDHLLDLKPDGSFRLDLSYFDFPVGQRMTNHRLHRLFGGPPRTPETALTQRDMDLARSLQVVTEDIVLRMARHVRTQTQARHLCLAGGVALNCVANGKVLREGLYDGLWMQPAAGDAGGALGAALAVSYGARKLDRPADGLHDLMSGGYLGPAFSQAEIEAFLRAQGYPFEPLPDTDALAQATAHLLAEGKVVGWFQGRMEYGPRALGARSILADPRSPQMQRDLNLKIKFREGFRPFAPAVLAEKATDWFDLTGTSPYMLLTTAVAPHRLTPLPQTDAQGFDRLRQIGEQSQIPAVTHVDYSARVQTVHRETNPVFHALLTAFDHLTGCPVLVNTSFNVRGEPIVCTPEDAYRCFMRSHMDVLVLERCILHRNQQPEWKETLDWKQSFELD
jgi:carbamoyltransferase